MGRLRRGILTAPIPNGVHVIEIEGQRFMVSYARGLAGSPCAACGKPIALGARIVFWGREAAHIPCLIRPAEWSVEPWPEVAEC